MSDLKEYLSKIESNRYEDLNLGIKDGAGNDIFIKVKNQTWGDFLEFISEFSAVSGKTDAVSLKKSKELSLKAICNMIVDDNGENYLTIEKLNSYPVKLVAAIDKTVSEYLVRFVKADESEELKKN